MVHLAPGRASGTTPLIDIEVGHCYLGGAMAARPAIQALTLRIAEHEYQLLRALAFSLDRSINDVACAAIRNRIDADRAHLEAVLQRAQGLRRERGQPAAIPRNPQRRGSTKAE